MAVQEWLLQKIKKEKRKDTQASLMAFLIVSLLVVVGTPESEMQQNAGLQLWTEWHHHTDHNIKVLKLTCK